MQKTNLSLALLSLLYCGTSAAYSQSTSTEFDYAEVANVTPQVRIVTVPVSREECWEEAVTQYAPPRGPRHHSYTSTIAGGIVGAVVGNQFGSGSGRDWATLGGAALGASIGRDHTARRAYAPGPAYTTTQERCRVVQDYRSEERSDGFLVTYIYNGREYQTTTASHPGDRIKVRVDVAPAEY